MFSTTPSPSIHPGRDLARLPWPEVESAARQAGSTVLWPWGSMEQHGPHLPLSTDAIFAERLVDALMATLSEELPIWRLPLQQLGFSPEHLGFAGTFSLNAEQLIELVETVGAELARCGFQRLLIMNGHGGQIGLLEVAARQLRLRHPSLAVLPCFLWRVVDLTSLIPEPERSQGMHAGLAETSLMLHLAPELVGSDRSSDGLHPSTCPPEGWSWEGPAPTAWLSSDLSQSGVIGDPSGATAELGEQLFERLLKAWQQRLQSLVRSNWPPDAKVGA